MTPEQKRQIARQSLAATQNLEKAITKCNIEGVRQAIEDGALPEMVQYTNSKGTPMGSALARAIRHRNLELLEYLLQEGAPMVGEKNKTLAELIIDKPFLEAFPLLKLYDYQPEAKDYLAAIEKDNLMALKCLENIKPWPRHQSLKEDNVSQSWHYLPIFLAQSGAMVEYLIHTGADFEPKGDQYPWRPLDWAIIMAVSFDPNSNSQMLLQVFGTQVVNQLNEMGNKDPTTAVEMMLDLGHPVDEKSLLLACRKGYPSLIRMIASRLPNLTWQTDQPTGTRWGQTKQQHVPYVEELSKTNPILLRQLQDEEHSQKQRQEIDVNTPSVRGRSSSIRI